MDFVNANEFSISENVPLNDSLSEGPDKCLEECLNTNFDDGSDENFDGNLNENVYPDNSVSDDGTDNDDEEPVLKNTTLEIISQDDWEIYGIENYYVKLLDEDNNPVSQALVNFRIETPKGTFIYETGFTDDEGMAILPLDLSIGGIHNIQVSYDGDSNYNPAESVYSNVIFYENTIIKTLKNYAYRSSDFTIKLVSSNGDVLSNKKLIIYLDGVKYIKTTDSKGQVYIRMPSDKKIC